MCRLAWSGGTVDAAVYTVLAHIPVSPFRGWFSRLSLYVFRLLPQ